MFTLPRQCDKIALNLYLNLNLNLMINRLPQINSLMFAKAMKHRNSDPYISHTCKLSFSKIKK